MAITGFSDRFLVNGYELSPYMQSFEGQVEMEEIEFTVLNLAARQYLQGNEEGTLECSGVFDADATNEDAIHNVLSTAFAIPKNHVRLYRVLYFCRDSDGVQPVVKLHRVHPHDVTYCH